MSDAVDNVLDSMSAAEASYFGSALSKMGKSASRLVSDPVFAQIVRTAAPIAGGALGTVIGGPAGTALGSQLGNLAAKALPAPAAPRPVPASPGGTCARPADSCGGRAGSCDPGTQRRGGVPAGTPPPPTPPAGEPAPAQHDPSAEAIKHPPNYHPGYPAAIHGSRIFGSRGLKPAAAQGLVLSQQPEVLRSLLATALGQHGRQQVSGVPVAQLLTLFSQVIGQAAADADQLMYLEQQADVAESVLDDAPAGSVRSLYADLLGADNLELAEAAGWEGLD